MKQPWVSDRGVWGPRMHTKESDLEGRGAVRIMATILIIDDEEGVRALLRTTLEAAGHKVVEAANGRIGLERYRHKPTDLIITDILMPELNGLDMILELTRSFLDAKVI